MTDDEGDAGEMLDEDTSGEEAQATAAWLADNQMLPCVAALCAFPPPPLLAALAQSSARDAPDMAAKLGERQVTGAPLPPPPPPLLSGHAASLTPY